jgi:hypothetical protein
MAKRSRQDEGPALGSSDDEPRLITYRGGHPLIRRCGYAFEPHKPKRVPAGVAAVLVAVRDFEDSSPSAPDDGDSELPPAA